MLALVTTALAVGMAACGDDDDEESGDSGTQTSAVEAPAGSSVAKIQEAGEIKIGVKYDVPPFGFKNPQNNQVEGFDVDLGKRIAEQLGVEPKFIEAISDNRIPFLTDGTADLILSTMTITAERDLEIDFSEPYFVARGRILVPQGSAIKGVDDLANKKVCTALGSTYEETLKKEAPKADLRLVDSYSECLESLQNGSVDAISTDDVILTGMIIQDDSLQLVGDELTQEPYGAGIKKGNTELRDFVNQVFEEYKQDGRYDKTYEKWVGQYTDTEPEPPDISVEEAVELVKQNEA